MPRVNREWFDTLLDAKVLIERWRRAYNTVRLRSFSPKSQCREPLRRIGQAGRPRLRWKSLAIGRRGSSFRKGEIVAGHNP